MCGVAGYVGLASDEVAVRAALESMAHRGPDDQAVVSGPGYALGYRRLAIRSVGSMQWGGRQPFGARQRRIHCFGVGEVYNSLELRAQQPETVEPVAGDVGGLLAAFLARGSHGFAKVVGEFACAVYDEERAELVLARDQLGTRGLFYTELGGSLIFASEIKGLVAMGVTLRPDRDTVAAYLRYNYPLTPNTFYEGVKSVPAGSALVWRDSGSYISAFADIGELAAEQAAAPMDVSGSHIREALTISVRTRMMADVPIGFHLSGGLDSSLVAHLSEARGLPAYTIDYEMALGTRNQGDGLWGSAVATELGLDWRFLSATPGDAIAELPDAQAIMDGPLMSPGAITPRLVARAAGSDGVKVLLEGQGADEVFLGYSRFAELWHDPTRDVADVAANVELADISAVAPGFLPKVEMSDDAFRRSAVVPGASGPLLGFQVAYLRHFLHELLRIEDHMHLASSVENRPPFLDGQVVRMGLAQTVRSPQAALGKPALRTLLAGLGSSAARRPAKQQMSIPLSRASAWGGEQLSREGGLSRLPSFDHGAVRELLTHCSTPSEQRLVWAVGNLAMWSESYGFEI